MQDRLCKNDNVPFFRDILPGIGQEARSWGISRPTAKNIQAKESPPESAPGFLWSQMPDQAGIRPLSLKEFIDGTSFIHQSDNGSLPIAGRMEG